jgi:hypothetical protein
MIIVRLSGGLGNQMFQYAAGRQLAHLLGSGLKLDTSLFDTPAPGDTPRRFELGGYAISAGMATGEERRICRELGRIKVTPLFRLLQRCGRYPSRGGIRYYRELGFRFDCRLETLPDNLCLEGFWQSEKYFSSIGDIIRQELTPLKELSGHNARLAERIAATNSVSLHIRRGDYVSNPAAMSYHGTCTLEYYAGALELIARRVERPHLFVFSDDPAWAAENLKCAMPTTFVDHNDADNGQDDLELMRRCRHNIIANSSFSWWGAWLNEHPGKTVIAPLRWFREPGVDTRDLIPEGWLRL